MVVGVKLGLHPAQLSLHRKQLALGRGHFQTVAGQRHGDRLPGVYLSNRTHAIAPWSHILLLGTPTLFVLGPGPVPSTDDMELEGSESQAAWC